MNWKKAKGTLIVVFVLSILTCLGADEIPSDVTPYVRLGHMVKVSVYRNPILDKSTESIVSSGQLIREEVVPLPVGSGTIISEDGLVLTNNHVYRMEEEIQYDENTKTLIRVQSASKNMLVYTLKDNDPLKVPELQYLAELVSLDENHDTALLRIVMDKDGNALNDQTFAFVKIGNPYAIRLNETLTIFGYPSKGGDTITITEGKFLGYYRDQRFPGLDGFIKTNAAMAPGNSGGAAMNKAALVGIPTAVTPPVLAGSDLGYIHPVTWAAKVMTIAKDKLELKAPVIPRAWLESEHNTDETHGNLYVTARVISSHSRQGIHADVIIAREDRTLEEIENLHLELQVVSTILLIQRLHSGGLRPESIASQFQLPLEEILNIIATKISEEDLSPDALLSMNGEFFYQNTESDDQGFFIISVPRGKKVKLYIQSSGFHNLEKEVSLETGLSQNLGKITLFQQQ